MEHQPLLVYLAILPLNHKQGAHCNLESILVTYNNLIIFPLVSFNPFLKLIEVFLTTLTTCTHHNYYPNFGCQYKE